MSRFDLAQPLASHSRRQGVQESTNLPLASNALSNNLTASSKSSSSSFCNKTEALPTSPSTSSAHPSIPNSSPQYISDFLKYAEPLDALAKLVYARHKARMSVCRRGDEILGSGRGISGPRADEGGRSWSRRVFCAINSSNLRKRSFSLPFPDSFSKRPFEGFGLSMEGETVLVIGIKVETLLQWVESRTRSRVLWCR
ncbi:TPR repeat motif-containing protein [Moniliophthora roreri]|nr:TPR repeat motif-containing protein [Moniliophthora roreri]